MNIFRHPAIVTLVLWFAFAPAPADAQGRESAQDALRAPRPLVLTLPRDPRSKEHPSWFTSTRLIAERGVASRVPSAQSAGNQRSERGVVRTVLGAVVGGTAGLFVGGYLGATIEGDRCHCDDPGLQGALIGAPVGAAAGGILGALFLF